MKLETEEAFAADQRNAAEPQPKRNIYHGGTETRRKPKSNSQQSKAKPQAQRTQGNFGGRGELKKKPECED